MAMSVSVRALHSAFCVLCAAHSTPPATLGRAHVGHCPFSCFRQSLRAMAAHLRPPACLPSSSYYPPQNRFGIVFLVSCPCKHTHAGAYSHTPTHVGAHTRTPEKSCRRRAERGNMRRSNAPGASSHSYTVRFSFFQHLCFLGCGCFDRWSPYLWVE